MNLMKEKISALSIQLERLSPRERLMILLAAIAVIYFVAHISVIGPLQDRKEALQEEKTANEERIAELSRSLETLEQRTLDPNAALEKKIARLQKDIRQLDKQLRSRSLDIVSPREMPKLLESFLARQQKLRLVSLENQAAKPLVERDEQQGMGDESERDALPNVYRHSVRMEFAGTYPETVAYLRTLEGLTRRLFWSSVDIEVENHPRARIVLKVYTLSLSKGWIGV